MTAGERVRVLVVDDQEDIRLLLGMILEEAGYEVHLAEHGEAALKQVERVKPPVVFLDLKMPRLDGWSVVDRLRDLEAPPSVILVSGATDEITRGRLDPPIAGFLLKPFRADEVVLWARKVMEARDAAARPADRRRAPRRPLLVEGRLVDENDEPVALGTIVNLSLGGAQFVLGASLGIGKTVRIAIPLPDAELPLLIDGEIRWSKEGALGMQFVHVSPEQEERLKKLLE